MTSACFPSTYLQHCTSARVLFLSVIFRHVTVTFQIFCFAVFLCFFMPFFFHVRRSDEKFASSMSLGCVCVVCFVLCVVCVSQRGRRTPPSPPFDSNLSFYPRKKSSCCLVCVWVGACLLLRSMILHSSRGCFLYRSLHANRGHPSIHIHPSIITANSQRLKLNLSASSVGFGNGFPLTHSLTHITGMGWDGMG
jgi:hypothetical protein